MTDNETFFDAYVTAALWSSVDEDGGPLDDEFDGTDLAPATRAAMKRDCKRFLLEQGPAIASGAVAENGDRLCGAIAQAGHDFWLTRNGHGCGFWDGDWSEPFATQLTDASEAFGAAELYVAEDQVWQFRTDEVIS